MDTKTALQKAINEKSEERVLNLLKPGINLRENGVGTDLLHLATRVENGERIIEHLLEYGAQPNHEVLISVCQRKYKEVLIEKLLKHGAEPTVNSTIIGTTNALHEVAKLYSDESKLCELLLKYGADANKDCYGCHTTPLFFAIENKNKNVIEVLLQYGANPLQMYYGPACPLQLIFNMPVPVIENIVKYASLHVHHDDDKSVFEFLAHFRGEKSTNEKSRLYFHFAMKCLAEIETLKQQWLIDNKSTLFDFVVSQGNAHSSFLSNASIVNKAFELLSTKLFPIYSEVILRKFERITIVNKVLEFSCLKWCVVSNGEKVSLDTYSIEYICKFLEIKDLRNLFLAFASPQ